MNAFCCLLLVINDGNFWVVQSFNIPLILRTSRNILFSFNQIQIKSLRWEFQSTFATNAEQNTNWSEMASIIINHASLSLSLSLRMPVFVHSNSYNCFTCRIIYECEKNRKEQTNKRKKWSKMWVTPHFGLSIALYVFIYGHYMPYAWCAACWSHTRSQNATLPKLKHISHAHADPDEPILNCDQCV